MKMGLEDALLGCSWLLFIAVVCYGEALEVSKEQ